MLKVFAFKSLQLWMDRVRWDIIEPSCFTGAGEMFLGSNINGDFTRYLLTLNKSLELE